MPRSGYETGDSFADGGPNTSRGSGRKWWFVAGSVLIVGGALGAQHLWDQREATLKARAADTEAIRKDFIGENYPKDIEVKYGGPTGHEVVATIGNKACLLHFEVTGDLPADNPGKPGVRFEKTIQTSFSDTIGHQVYHTETSQTIVDLGNDPHAYTAFVNGAQAQANHCS